MESDLEPLIENFRSLGLYRCNDYVKYNLDSISRYIQRIESASYHFPAKLQNYETGEVPSPPTEDTTLDYNISALYNKIVFLAHHNAEITPTRLRRLLTLMTDKPSAEFIFFPEQEEITLLNVLSGIAPRSYANYRKIPKHLEQLCLSLNYKRHQRDKLSIQELYNLSFEAYYNFLLIRPWRKGNGVMAWLLMNWLQFEFRLAPSHAEIQALPEFLKALSESFNTSDISHFRNFMMRATLLQISEDIEAFKDLPKKVPSPQFKSYTALKIITLLRENPSHTTTTLAKAIEIKPKGIEKQLAKLRKRGKIRRNGPARGGVWEVITDETLPPGINISEIYPPQLLTEIVEKTKSEEV